MQMGRKRPLIVVNVRVHGRAGTVSGMANQDEEQPFTPSLTEARLPSVDHMFNQGMLNVILDRTLGGPPAGVPRERPEVGLLATSSDSPTRRFANMTRRVSS